MNDFMPGTMPFDPAMLDQSYTQPLQIEPEPSPADKGLIVHFYKRPIFLRHRSQTEGKPIYQNEDFVQIITPGQDKSIVDRKVKQSDKRRWPEKWQAYQTNQAQVEDGIPIEEWPMLDPAAVASLRAMGFRTVEMVARMSDAQAQGVMGGVGFRRKAQLYLTEYSERSATASFLERTEDYTERTRGIEGTVNRIVVANDYEANQAAGVLDTIRQHRDLVDRAKLETKDLHRREIERINKRAEASLQSLEMQITTLRDAERTMNAKISAWNTEREKRVAEAGPGMAPGVVTVPTAGGPGVASTPAPQPATASAAAQSAPPPDAIIPPGEGRELTGADNPDNDEFYDPSVGAKINI